MADAAAPSGLMAVYQEARGDLLRFLTARLGDPSEAEDAVQELYLRLGGLSAGPVGNARAYLFRAAQNVALDRVRERQRRLARDGAWVGLHHGHDGKTDPADDRADAEAAILDRQRDAALAAAIGALPEGAGRVFRLHKIEGVPQAQIAARLGISRSGVEKHLATAMAHLRRALQDQ